VQKEEQHDIEAKEVIADHLETKEVAEEDHDEAKDVAVDHHEAPVE